jgi:hypothetical protein
VLRFIVGCLPVYMAYALFGTLMFGKISAHFSSVRRSLITLFSLLNGDSMLQIFDSIRFSGWAGLVSEVYLISFVCLFIYSALNIFIQIMQSAFDHTQVKWHQKAQKIAGLEAWATAPASVVATDANGAGDATNGLQPESQAGSGLGLPLPQLQQHQQQQQQQQQQPGWPPVNPGDRFGSWQRGQLERMRAHAPAVGFVSCDQSLSDDDASARSSIHDPRDASLVLSSAQLSPVETSQHCRLSDDRVRDCANDDGETPPPMPGESICESSLAPLSPGRQLSGRGSSLQSAAGAVYSSTLMQQQLISLLVAREGVATALAAMDSEIESLQVAVAAMEADRSGSL